MGDQPARGWLQRDGGQLAAEIGFMECRGPQPGLRRIGVQPAESQLVTCR